VCEAGAGFGARRDLMSTGSSEMEVSVSLEDISGREGQGMERVSDKGRIQLIKGPLLANPRHL
jgi:hypothetical protein